MLYETSAINRYVDEIQPALSLQPSAPKDRARMNQIIGILDNYCYRPMIWEIYVQRVVVPAGGVWRGCDDAHRVGCAVAV